MPIDLQVNGQIFSYPLPGDRNWGEDASGWAEAITTVVGTLTGAGFIPQTTVPIEDNISVAADIVNAAFDSSATRSFQFIFEITRTDGAVTIAETGRMDGVFNGTEWDYNVNRVGDAGVVLSIDTLGQLQYTSSNLGGTYSGSIRFFANAISV